MHIYPSLELEVILIDAIEQHGAKTAETRARIYSRARDALLRRFEMRPLGEVVHLLENLEMAIDIVEESFLEHEAFIREDAGLEE